MRGKLWLDIGWTGNLKYRGLGFIGVFIYGGIVQGCKRGV